MNLLNEERVGGQLENHGEQLLLTAEEWMRREYAEGQQLLLTNEEWKKRSPKDYPQKARDGSNGYQNNRDGRRGPRDRSKVRCFNFHVYGQYASECRKPRREKEQKPEVNLARVPNDDPALSLTECDKEKCNVLLFDEVDVMPRLKKKLW